MNVQINLFLNNAQFLIEKQNKTISWRKKDQNKQQATGACLATLSVVPLKLKFYPPVTAPNAKEQPCLLHKVCIMGSCTLLKLQTSSDLSNCQAKAEHLHSGSINIPCDLPCPPPPWGSPGRAQRKAAVTSRRQAGFSVTAFITFGSETPIRIECTAMTTMFMGVGQLITQWI